MSSKESRGRRAYVCVAAAIVVFAGALEVGPGSPAFAGAKRPDLSVVSLGRVPATVTVGKSFQVNVGLKNKGRAAAPASHLTFFLSYDRLKGPTSTRLGTQISVARMVRGAKRQVKAKIVVPKSAPTVDSYLIVCADGRRRVKESNESNNCRSSQEQIELIRAPDTFGLIEAALRRGEISEEQAILYKIYADAGDPRLPGAFGKPPESFEGGDGLEQAAAQWTDLSQELREELDPYFSPPAYEGAAVPGSPSEARSSGTRRIANEAPDPAEQFCIEERGGATQRIMIDTWKSVDTDHFRFWYYTTDQGHPLLAAPEVSQQAAHFLANVAETIYEQETSLWREPLSDEGLSCNGGDGRFDVYLYRMSAGKIAQVVPYPPGKEKRPGWAYINPSVVPQQDLRDVLAHEFAHAIQLAYDYPDPHGPFEYGWLEEASATWAMDYVYPSDDYEHVFNDFFHTRPTYPLGECINGLCRNGYRDWIFFYFLTQNLQDPAAMSRIWDNTESFDSVTAVDQAVGGKFDEQFAEFALHGMNREDYDEFKAWDGINFGLFTHGHQPGPLTKVDMGGAKLRKYLLPGASGAGRDVEARAFELDRYTFEDKDIRSIKFKDFGYRDYASQPPRTESTRIKVWYKLANGERVTEDWTELQEMHFCRDREDQDIQELILFYVHGRPLKYLEHDPRTFPKVDASLTVSERCSFPKTFTGTANGTFSYGSRVETWTDTFKLKRAYQDPGSNASYQVVEEKIDVSLSGEGGCGDGSKGPATASHTWTFDSGGWVLSLYGPESPPVLWPPNTYNFELDPGPLWQIDGVTVDCGGGETEKQDWYPLNCGDSGSTGYLPWDGRSQISGSRTYATGYEACDVEGQIQVTWNWSIQGRY